ncbi:hypothetical protein [Asanoa iriomotensis]|uniref:40-residue YVTN family beta-propeller repeat-containing protein n=1 Tax=Asanoa iriomotensis TaxID=234613 RepID=A0ABQ4BZB2_9ACTN|nr:hypothetical protein [Asanoa iriomotensis]GIF55866.1 hypothetical protein Air01nite_19610 [Asanoa iriomotensis]
MRRISTIAGIAATLLVAGGPPASAQTDYDQPLETANSTTLFNGFADLAKSDATGRILISPGRGFDEIIVADLDGQVIGAVPGQAGATGLALSKDGRTAYAALADAGAVSVIDVATATETARYPIGGNTCPYDVALAGGKLWFSYGCYGISNSAIGSIDIAAPGTPMALGQGGYLTFTPRLASGSIDDGVLFAAVEGEFPNRLISYDVSGGTAVRRTALEDRLSSVSEFTVTPDGSAIIAATPGEYQFTTKLGRYSTTDLTEQGRYAVPGQVVGIAVEPDGRVATYSDDHGIAYFAPGEYEPRWVVYRNFAPGLDPAHRGIAIGGPGRLHLVQKMLSNSMMALTTVDATPMGTSLAVEGPFFAYVRKPVTFTGTLAAADGTATGVRTVQVTRRDPRGTTVLRDVLTAADGSFTVTDKPRVVGETTWTFTFAGTERLLPSTFDVGLTVDR